MRNLLDIQNDLSQHITQAKAIIDYLSVDISCNGGFSVSNEIIANTLWAAKTLLTNADNTQNELNQAIRLGGKQ